MNFDRQSFDSCFEVILADTAESKQIHYKLRYQVYCDEMGFEDKDKFSDQMETDVWDDHSTHFLVRQKGSGDWLGGMRLIRHDDFFPFEEWSRPYQKITRKDRQFSVEMSRLCIVKEARRFNSRRFAPYGLPDEEFLGESNKVKSIFNFKNQSRSLVWGLIRAAGVYSAQHNVVDWYFVVAPALSSFLTKEGLDLRQIGDACDHRGIRIPYRLTVENVLENPLWLKDYRKGYRLYSDVADESLSKRKVFC